MGTRIEGEQQCAPMTAIALSTKSPRDGNSRPGYRSAILAFCLKLPQRPLNVSSRDVRIYDGKHDCMQVCMGSSMVMSIKFATIIGGQCKILGSPTQVRF